MKQLKIGAGFPKNKEELIHHLLYIAEPDNEFSWETPCESSSTKYLKKLYEERRDRILAFALAILIHNTNVLRTKDFLEVWE